MDPLEKETAVAQELAALRQLLAQHPVVQEFQRIQQRAQKNQKLMELEEADKQTQRENVQYETVYKQTLKMQAKREGGRLWVASWRAKTRENSD